MAGYKLSAVLQGHDDDVSFQHFQTTKLFLTSTGPSRLIPILKSCHNRVPRRHSTSLEAAFRHPSSIRLHHILPCYRICQQYRVSATSWPVPGGPHHIGWKGYSYRSSRTFQSSPRQRRATAIGPCWEYMRFGRRDEWKIHC